MVLKELHAMAVEAAARLNEQVCVSAVAFLSLLV